jgi:hypothetical protein
MHSKDSTINTGEMLANVGIAAAPKDPAPVGVVRRARAKISGHTTTRTCEISRLRFQSLVARSVAISSELSTISRRYLAMKNTLLLVEADADIALDDPCATTPAGVLERCWEIRWAVHPRASV